MKGILFVKIGYRYTMGIVHRNTYYHIYIKFGQKFKLGFNTYHDHADIVIDDYPCWFFGLIKI